MGLHRAHVKRLDGREPGRTDALLIMLDVGEV
jgi:hypothetical protein